MHRAWRFGVLLVSLLVLGLSFGPPGTATMADQPVAFESSVDAVEVGYVANRHGLSLEEAAGVVEMQMRAELLAQELADAYPKNFAGAWMVWKPQPSVMFGVAGVEGTHSFAKKVEDAGFHVQVMAVSLKELDASMATLNEALALDRAGSRASDDVDAYVDVREGRIEVRVESESELVSEVRRIAADEPLLRVQASTLELGGQGDACTALDCDPPLRGGPKVTGSSGAACSLGFTMADSGDRFASTASHCSGSPWSHAGTSIGPTFWTLDSGSVDAKAITINSPNFWEATNLIRRPSDLRFRIVLQIENPGASLIGITICRVGYRNGGDEYCGELATYNASKYGNTHQGKVDDALACPGDSGGPWFNPSTSRAYGLHMGSDDDDNCNPTEASYFTWVPYFESMSGLHIRLNP